MIVVFRTVFVVVPAKRGDDVGFKPCKESDQNAIVDWLLVQLCDYRFVKSVKLIEREMADSLLRQDYEYS